MQLARANQLVRIYYANCEDDYVALLLDMFKPGMVLRLADWLVRSTEQDLFSVIDPLKHGGEISQPDSCKDYA
jgi:hypothetical protein